MKIMNRIDTAEFKALMNLVDPYVYRHRLTMPKYIINATGDSLFLPDSSRFYYDGLEGPKLLQYVPNSDHNVDETNSVLSYFHAISTGVTLPEMSWTTDDTGTLHVVSNRVPKAANLWQASNANARDFRVGTIGETWIKSPLEIQPDGGCSVQVTKPDKGWKAYFVEMVFDLGAPVPLLTTTSVTIMPDVYPDGSALNDSKL